ncbi:alpha/beta hydrolase [Streptomyces sp. NPDC057238]|uniref:alpha/beta hydrolase n=1 Tax=Streptomyces sp. NPDC057238 TaxID=3346060 RepID=UPI003625827D
MEHADGTPRPGPRRLPTPSAPLSAARARAGELGNVRLLTHHGHGHTALFDTSGRVQAHESRCLVDGTLPPPGATCERDTPPVGRYGRHRLLSGTAARHRGRPAPGRRVAPCRFTRPWRRPWAAVVPVTPRGRSRNGSHGVARHSG